MCDTEILDVGHIRHHLHRHQSLLNLGVVMVLWWCYDGVMMVL
jgi:hypothetical protein